MNGRSGTVIGGIVALIFILAAMIVAINIGGSADTATPLIASMLALVGASIPALIGLAKIEHVQAEQREVKSELLTEQQDVKAVLLAEQASVKAELELTRHDLNSVPNEPMKDNIKQALIEYNNGSNGDSHGR